MFCTRQTTGNAGGKAMSDKPDYNSVITKIHNMKLDIPLQAWWVRGCAIGGLFGLIGLIALWNGWLAPIQQVPLWLEMLIFIFPLALLIRGILRGQPTTHVYATLVSLIYLIFGCWYIFTPQEEIYGYLMLLFAVMLYIGGFFGAKLLTNGE